MLVIELEHQVSQIICTQIEVAMYIKEIKMEVGHRNLVLVVQIGLAVSRSKKLVVII